METAQYGDDDPDSNQSDHTDERIIDNAVPTSLHCVADISYESDCPTDPQLDSLTGKNITIFIDMVWYMQLLV